MATVAIYWFRSDLRLADNPSFLAASCASDYLLPVYCHAPQSSTAWGFDRIGTHRLLFLRDALADLRQSLQNLGSDLLELHPDPQGSMSMTLQLATLVAQYPSACIYCEAIHAPEELAQVEELTQLGITMKTLNQSTMVDVDSLPFSVKRMPDQFTQYRQQIERGGYLLTKPIHAPTAISALPLGDVTARLKFNDLNWGSLTQSKVGFGRDARSSFPYGNPAFRGGESAALAHVEQYLERALPHSYKETRNQLLGIDYSSKFSPWLAMGCISARTIAAKLRAFEEQSGANEGSYWLWFELLWRDYFRILHLKWGNALYGFSGLGKPSAPKHNAVAFEQWCSGVTGESLVDAGMRELKVTGYLSNRLRQIVASYLIYDLECDWRAGAAWFESQLIDYDVYSNQGNWLYIAGKGTDPRGGRRFNPQKQAADHDPSGVYRALWLAD